MSYVLIPFALIACIWISHTSWRRARVSAPRPHFQVLAAAQAAVIAVGAGWYAWHRFHQLPQPYPALVSGYLAFNNVNKVAEYYGLYVAVGAFVVIYLLGIRLYAAIPRQPAATEQVARLGILSLIPAAVMLGQALRNPSTVGLLALSVALIVDFLLVATVLIQLFTRRLIRPDRTWELGAKLALTPVFLFLSDLGVEIALTRLGTISYPLGATTLLGVLCLGLMLGKLGLRKFMARIDMILAVSQFGVPLLFTILLSPPVRLQTGELTFFPYRPTLPILVGVLMILAYADAVRRFRATQLSTRLSGPGVSPWILFAILVYATSSPVVWPNISADDYHSAEYYLPWWLFKAYGYLPFADYVPSRGLTSYTQGFLAWAFHGNSFSSQSMVWNIHTTIYTFLAFFALRLIVGDLVAFLTAFSLLYELGAPGTGLQWGIAGLVLLWRELPRERPVRALGLWLAISVWTALVTIAEGVALAIGTIPIGLWLGVHAWRRSRRRLILFALIVAAAIGVLLITTRLPEVALAAGRYLLEQSRINDAAHSITWQIPIGDAAQSVTSGYLWQVIRYSWLLVLIPLTIRLSQRAKEGWWNRERLLLVALFILTVLLIPKAGGRVDITALSRSWSASATLGLCALPIVVLTATIDPMKRAYLLLLTAFLFGLVGFQESRLLTAWSNRDYIATQPSNLVSGDRLGLRNIGADVVMDKTQLQRQTAIRKVLSGLLGPNETYYDATNHSADYGYQGRPSPVADVAFYNAPSEAQQRRVVQSLEESHIPLALVQAENGYFDGGPLSLRAYWVYRYLVETFVPFESNDGHIWLIRGDEVGRLGNTTWQTVASPESISLLSNAFWQEDLLGLPAAWGASISSFSQQLDSPVDLLHHSTVLASADMRKITDTSWQSMGGAPQITFILPAGLKGDVLFMKTREPISGQSVQISWQNGWGQQLTPFSHFRFWSGGSAYLVPMSSAPSWLLAASIKSIRIDLPADFVGAIEFERLELMDRLVHP